MKVLPEKTLYDTDVESEMPDRWNLLRDVAVFQIKLIADGFRDLLLVPISLGAAIVALLKKGSKPGSEFYDLLRVGRRSENWINLFGAVSNVHGPANEDEPIPGRDIDQLVAKVESFVVEEYRSGGITAQARKKIERALDALQKRRGSNSTD